MTIIRVRKSWKDYVTTNPTCHSHLTRRDFLSRGMATGAMSLLIPKVLAGSMIRRALAGSSVSCPTPMGAAGGLVQTYENGGITVGGRFLSQAQAEALSAGGSTSQIAQNYGVTGGSNIQQIGSNWYGDITHPFMLALMNGPGGSTSQATWKSQVLSQTSVGAVWGPFNQDDGAGSPLGNVAGCSSVKPSVLGKDLSIGINVPSQTWSSAMPKATFSGGTQGLTSAGLAKGFGLTSNGFNFAATSTAVGAIASAVAANSAGAKAGSSLVNAASCGFSGDQVMASPTFGTSLFTPSGISALANIGGVASSTNAALTPEEQAQLAAVYQSCVGQIAGVVVEFDNRDYHGSGSGNTSNQDYEVARFVVMALAAAQAANAPLAIIMTTNGQAIANGTGPGAVGAVPTGGTAAVTVTDSNGNTETGMYQVNGSNAAGDGGGAYNACFVLLFKPSGAAPTMQNYGSLALTGSNISGNATNSAQIASVNDAMGAAYLTALTFISSGNTVPPSTLATLLAGSGVNTNAYTLLG